MNQKNETAVFVSEFARIALSITLIVTLLVPVSAFAVGENENSSDTTSAEEILDTQEDASLEDEINSSINSEVTNNVSNQEESDASSSQEEAIVDDFPGVGKDEIYRAGIDDPEMYDQIYSQQSGQKRARAAARSSSTLTPMDFSEEMLYFCKYESSRNYDQGFSSGDGYHALGYFQFDNRYGLGDFLKAVYNYDSNTYSCLKVIGDRYNWNTNGTIRSNGAFTQLGNDLNTAWHSAYAANPTEFSQLQNGWAYIQYYDGSAGVRGSLQAMGIDIDSRADCVKGLVWGMSNLFGQGGGASYINQGYYYGANWFFKNSGINNSMTDEELVTTLCDYVVNNVAARYPSQPQYHQGWQNRYKNEKADCLKYLASQGFVKYSSHVSNIGWSSVVKEGTSTGAPDKQQLEAFTVTLNSNYSGSVLYKSCIEESWETDWVSDGEVSGTTGESKYLTAIQIMLSGEVAVDYDIYYRVYVKDFGWLGWAKNGESAGTTGYEAPIQAYEIQVTKKGADAPGSTVRAFVDSQVVNLSYYTHVQDYGDQNVVGNGEVSGTTGSSKRLEAIRITLDNGPYSGGIEYSTHIQEIGWQDYVSSGKLSGTEGRKYRLEAIRIRLTGEIAEHYDVYYRVHAQNFDWMGWAKNGELAGTEEYAYRLEAIQIVLVEKGSPAPDANYGGVSQVTEQAFTNKNGDGLVNYKTHVQNDGWQDYVSDGQMSGTSGKSLRLEGIKINLGRTIAFDGGIEYATHVQNIGWQDYVSDNAMSGTEGKKYRLEAIKIRLTDDMAEKYDVYYRVHAQNFGWMGWAKNGEEAGTAGYAYRLEGIQIVLVEKGSSAPEDYYQGISSEDFRSFAQKQ